MLPLLRQPLPYRQTGLAHGVILANEPALEAPWDRSSAVLSIRLNYQRHHEWDIEQVFRSEKALLATRPIYHQTDAAICGHVFCSFLALVLRKDLEERLAAAGLKPEWHELLADLNRLQEIEAEQDGKHFILRTPVTGVAGKAFQAVGVALPPNIRDTAPASVAV